MIGKMMIWKIYALKPLYGTRFKDIETIFLFLCKKKIIL